jgi:hypothetical protein
MPRRLLVDDRFCMLMKMPKIQQEVEPYNLAYGHTIAFVELRNGRKISCDQFADRASDVSYMYSWYLYPTSTFDCGKGYQIVKELPENSVSLPPFEKHVYDRNVQ